ncbi:MAG: RNA polymerase-binding protein DksA [Proteobacteria bacterium]|nr:RNA polymerase-binding protein DksA [Pseudomonadota bacterium]
MHEFERTGEENAVSKPAAQATKAKTAHASDKPAEKTALKASAGTAAKTSTKAAPVAAPRSKPKTEPVPTAAAAAPALAQDAVPGAADRDAAPSAGAVAAGNRFTDRFAPARPTMSAPPIAPPAAAPRKIDPRLANAWKTKAGRDLSEDELLAMPEAEYMNDKQLDFFRNRLQQQKDDLLSNADQTTENLREDTTIVPDPADRATIEEEHALELRTRDRERKLLKKIAQSLARLEAGDYGYCDETGEPIGLARLLARPTATLSLEAQQRRELKQKMFGD